jgi:tetratricopeptide (TPR) repeat protein
MVPRRCVRAITMLAAAGLAVQSGLSQGRGGTGPPAGGGSSTGGAGTVGTPSPGTATAPSINIPTNPNSIPNPNTNPQPTGFPQPIPISGRVLVEDGNPPTEMAVIERVCGGSTRAEGYTDSKGYFFIELGNRNNGILQDASEVGGGFGDVNPGGRGSGPGGFGSGTSRGIDSSEMRFVNCELRARLAGYRSQVVSLANRRALDNPDIGTILLHRLAPSGGNTVSASALEVPKDARKAFDKGQDSSKKGKLDDALKNYSKAVELYRSYAAAWYELGKLQAAGGDPYTARGSFNEAAKADPKFVAALVAIADIDIQSKKWREVVEVTDRAAKLDAFDYPQVFFFNGVANYNLKNLDAAEKSAKQAERLDTRHRYPQVYFLLGIISAVHQEYSAAAEKFRTYLKLAPDAADAATARKQLDQVEKLSASAQAQKQDQ